MPAAAALPQATVLSSGDASLPGLAAKHPPALAEQLQHHQVVTLCCLSCSRSSQCRRCLQRGCVCCRCWLQLCCLPALHCRLAAARSAAAAPARTLHGIRSRAGHCLACKARSNDHLALHDVHCRSAQLLDAIGTTTARCWCCQSPMHQVQPHSLTATHLL
jgi:hypothetical protein